MELELHSLRSQKREIEVQMEGKKSEENKLRETNAELEA